MAGRLVAVPDTDQELTHLLGRLEEVLLALVAVEADDEPASAGLGTDALDAVQDIRGAVLAAERGPTAQLYASDGTFELIALRFVELDEAQLAAVGEAVADLGLALLPGGDEFAHDVLSGFAERYHGIRKVAPEGNDVDVSSPQHRPRPVRLDATGPRGSRRRRSESLALRSRHWHSSSCQGRSWTNV